MGNAWCSTSSTNNTDEHSTENIEANVIKEGYLYKKSLHLNKTRKRWIVLKGNHLYCYKDAFCNKLTEKMYLKSFDNVKPSKTSKPTQFTLTSSKKNRNFIATSVNDMMDWVKYINHAIHGNMDQCKVCINDDNGFYDDDDDVMIEPKEDPFATSSDEDDKYLNDNEQNVTSQKQSTVRFDIDSDEEIDEELDELFNVRNVNKMEQNKNKYIMTANDRCDVRKCKSIQHIISALTYHQLNFHRTKNTDNDVLLQRINECGTDLINSYHHILDEHLNNDVQNDQFKSIYNEIMNMKDILSCNIDECEMYLRHNRQREKQTIQSCNGDENLLFYLDLLDSIHCYFIHSIDTGYRIIDNIDIHDINFKSLKTYLFTKKAKLWHSRGDKRVKNNKFVTQIVVGNNDNLKEMKQDDDDTENIKVGRYSFGEAHKYWNDCKIKGKYNSIKEEVTSNAIYCISMDRYNEATHKATKLLNESDKIKSIKSIEEFEYDIYAEKPLGIDNILVVVLYTDYDTLSYHFSGTFRKMDGNETSDQVQKRNMEFWNWSKLLIETINCYGTKVSASKSNENIKSFYHGISMMYFDSFINIFNSPTSTTTKLSVATIFAKNDGIILELQPYDEHTMIRYFNCSFFSYFGYENEHLFIEPVHDAYYYYLRIISIRNMATNENYKQYITAISKFEKIIKFKNNFKEFDNFEDEICDTNDISIILSLMIADNTNIPDYILKTFKNWINQKNEIDINLKCLPTQIFQTNIVNLPAFDKINCVFKNVEKIKIWEIDTISSMKEYFTAFSKILEKINTLKFTKLNMIQLENVKNVSNNFDGDYDMTEYESLISKHDWKIESSYYSITLIRNIKASDSNKQAKQPSIFESNSDSDDLVIVNA